MSLFPSRKKSGRYVTVISRDIPSKTVASLHTVGQGCRVPLLEITLVVKNMKQKRTKIFKRKKIEQ